MNLIMSTTSIRVGYLQHGFNLNRIVYVWETHVVDHPPFPGIVKSIRGEGGISTCGVDPRILHQKSRALA